MEVCYTLKSWDVTLEENIRDPAQPACHGVEEQPMRSAQKIKKNCRTYKKIDIVCVTLDDFGRKCVKTYSVLYSKHLINICADFSFFITCYKSVWQKVYEEMFYLLSYTFEEQLN